MIGKFIHNFVSSYHPNAEFSIMDSVKMKTQPNETQMHIWGSLNYGRSYTIPANFAKKYALDSELYDCTFARIILLLWSRQKITCNSRAREQNGLVPHLINWMLKYWNASDCNLITTSLTKNSRRQQQLNYSRCRNSVDNKRDIKKRGIRAMIATETLSGTKLKPKMVIGSKKGRDDERDWGRRPLPF